jgi:hypothetical protein
MRQHDRAIHSAKNALQQKRAGEGTRTLDIQLGKLALYQLSYAREFFAALRTT